MKKKITKFYKMFIWALLSIMLISALLIITFSLFNYAFLFLLATKEQLQIFGILDLEFIFYFLVLIVAISLIELVLVSIKRVIHKEPYCTIKVYPEKNDDNLCYECANEHCAVCPLKLEMDIKSKDLSCNPIVTECKYYKKALRGKYDEKN